ncbi:hypothetical protein DH2020_007153 [Rehmannia glutinosa]|uniref:Uncharacterized protein n=1 Tax=Rehmannia glutinosa TaxID=99300 RepID=A0ABR0TXP8_REHGL
MNEHIEERKWCYFHPREIVIGVCALCLKERLLILASKQAHNIHHHQSVTTKKVLPKIFALTSLINPLDIKHQKSLEFEDNGVASWDKEKISKMSINDHHQQCEMSWDENNLDKANKIKSVVEHAKPRATLRWRKRIGHLVQLIRWKRSSKGNMCHVGTKLEGAKVKQGWIRVLTKRRTKE